MLEPITAEFISCDTSQATGPSLTLALQEITMHRRQPTADSQPSGRPPAPGTASNATPGPADLVQRRQLEKSVSWSGRERLRCLWYRLRLTVAKMNYATRRMVEVQAPWIADDRPR